MTPRALSSRWPRSRRDSPCGLSERWCSSGSANYIVGRKYTFLITMSIMGGATFAVGLLPNYATVGVLVGAMIVLPIILAYTALSYWVFRRKVRHGDEGYH